MEILNFKDLWKLVKFCGKQLVCKLVLLAKLLARLAGQEQESSPQVGH